MKWAWNKLKATARYLIELGCAVAANLIVMPLFVYLAFWVLETFYDPDFSPRGRWIHFPGYWSLLWTYLAVGLWEETLFRYFLQDCLLKKILCLPKWMGIAIASVVFGAMHLGNFGGIPWTIPQAVGATVAGFGYGWLYEKRGLHFCILTHGLYDFFIMAQFFYWN